MELHFGPVMAQFPALVAGMVLTIQLSVLAIILGGFVGLAAAMIRNMGPRPLRWLVDVYVEIIRNTPFLVQLYIVFFGLPTVGLRINAVEAGLLAMTVNLGAYATEIFRAGIDSVHRSQIEAGAALALTRLQVFRHVILKPSVARVWPSLVSQFILIMLASSICSFISVEELSGAANTIQSETYRSLEVYFVAGVMYLALALVLKSALFGLGHWLFGRRRQPAAARRALPLAARGGGA